MTIKFLLKNPKEGLNTIHIRVRNGKNVDLFLDTRQKTLLEDWNAKDGKLLEEYQAFRNGKMVTLADAQTKKKISENKDINDKLNDLEKMVRKNYSDNPNQILNPEWLKNLLFPAKPDIDKSEMTFLEYADIFVKDKGSTISDDYVTKVGSIKSIVERYLKARRKKTLRLIEIDNNFKNDFEVFCIKESSMKLNYLERNFKFIKTILYHAQNNGFEIYSGLSKIRCKTEPTLFVTFSPQEIEMLKQAKFSDESLQTARDWLLISVFTAQRISDFMNFKTRMISEKLIDGKKRYFIEFVQQKTKAQVLFPLDQEVINILKARNWQFPRPMSETRYNRQIKVVCEMAGIDEVVEGALFLDQNGEENKEKKKKKNGDFKYRKVDGYYPKWKLVTSHIGRRTWSTLNYGKIPTPLMLRMTGHKNAKMLMNYIGKIEEEFSLALADYIK